MKYLISVLLCVLLFGCDASKEEVVIINKEANGDWSIINIDSCEYLYKTKDRGLGLAHKGNCSNPIHCYNKIED